MRILFNITFFALVFSVFFILTDNALTMVGVPQ